MAYFDKLDIDPTLIGGGASPEKPKPAGFLRSVADLGIEAASGVARGVKGLAGAFGADNSVAQGADAVDKFAREYLSASAKADDQRVSEIMAAAQDAGVWEQVKAAAEAFTVKPAGMVLNAFGTSVPTIAAALIPGVGQAGVAARLGALGAMGAAQGAGAVKGSIYEAVKAEQIKAGASEAEAEAAAVRAQEYGGENTANIVGGAALGGAASATGVQPVIAKMLQRGAEPVAQAQRGMLQRALNPEGLLARTGMGALKEAPLEAAQGGQEQYASNIALQNEGFNTPAFRGVAGSAALEGLASAGPGAAFAALDKPNVQPVSDPNPGPEAPVLPLTYGSSKPMVQFRDGSVGTQEDAERYLNSLSEKDRPAARAKLLGLAPQKVDVSDVLGAESVDDAIDLANKAAGLTRPIPAGEATEFDALPDNIPVEDITYAPPPDKVLAGQASELTPELINADAALMRFRTPQQIADDGIGPIPTGEAADLIPTGDAAEVETLPVGEVLEGDLLARDGEPFTSKTGAQAKAYASGGGKVVAIPNHFGSGVPGYVVRPLMPGRPSNTRGTDARDLPRSSNVNQPDVAGTAGQPVADGAGRPDAAVGGELAAGRVASDATGRKPGTAAAVAPGSAGDAPVGAGDAPNTALTVQKGLTVTFGGKTYPVQSVEDAQAKWERFRDSADGGGAAGVSQIGNGVEVRDGAGNFVARISYNGRVWDTPDEGPTKPTPKLPAPDALAQARRDMRGATEAIDRWNDEWRNLYRDGVAYFQGDGKDRKLSPSAPDDIKERYARLRKQKGTLQAAYDEASARVTALTPAPAPRPAEPAPVAAPAAEPAPKPRQLNGSDSKKAEALFQKPDQRGAPDLAAGQRVTLNGTPYTIASVNSTAVKLQGEDGSTKMVARGSKTFGQIQPDAAPAPAEAPRSMMKPGFDPDAWQKARDDRIKASREAGNTHLDKVDAYVETMRGLEVYGVHDTKVRGRILTVDNNGNVYVEWLDAYSQEKEGAVPMKYGKKTVMQTSLGPRDLKDYVVGKPAKEPNEAARPQAQAAAGEGAAPAAAPATAAPAVVPRAGSATDEAGRLKTDQPPMFESYADAQQWVAAQTKKAGGALKFRASDEYKAAYEQIKALYDAEKKGSDQERLADMKAAGLAVGDKVQTFVRSMFLGGDMRTGTIAMRGGAPIVKIDGEMAVSGPGGKLRYVQSLPWDARWKKAAPATPNAEAPASTQATAPVAVETDGVKPPESALRQALRSVGIDPDAPRDKAKDKATTLRKRADALMTEARKMLEGIPPGQPVFSTRDANLRERAREKTRKAGELYGQADELETTANAEAPVQAAPRGAEAAPVAPAPAERTPKAQAVKEALAKTPKRTEARGKAKHPKTVAGSSVLAMVSESLGGLDPKWLSEFSTQQEINRIGKNGRRMVQWRNPLIPGVGRLFRSGGTQDLQQLAELMESAGYLEPGSVEADTYAAGQRAKDMVRDALNKDEPLTWQGRLSKAQEEAKDEALSEPDWLSEFNDSELDEAGYTESAPDVQQTIAALLAEAEALGLDTESMVERAAMQAGDQPGNAYDEIIQRIAGEAIAGARRQAGGADTGTAGAGNASGGTAAGEAGQEPAAQEGLTLEAQTAEDLRAKTEREAAGAAAERAKKAADQERLRREAEQRDIRARADQTVDDFQLGQSADQQLSGVADMFADPPAAAPAPIAAPTPAAQAPAGRDEQPPAEQAAAILNAAAEPPKGKERLDVLKDVKSGAITPEEVAAAFPPAGEVAAVEPVATTGTESLNKRHAIPKKQALTPAGSLKADATNSRADSAVWYYQGDMDALRFTASVKVNGEADPRAGDAKRMLVQIKAAQDAGWRRANYRAGSLGTVWVFQRGDEFLTRAGMENAAAVEVQRPAMPDDGPGWDKMVARQRVLARAFNDWLLTMPEDQQYNRGVVSRKIGETPVGQWAGIGDDSKLGLTLRYFPGPGEKEAREVGWTIQTQSRPDWPALRDYIAELAAEAPTDSAPAAAEVPATAAAPASALDAFKAVMQAVYDGTATVEDYQAGYARVRDETAMKAELGKLTKDELTRMFGIMRDGKKDELVALAYSSMLRNFAMGKEYGPSGGYMMTRNGLADYEAKKRAALDELVAGQTADDLAAFAAEQKRISEERAGKRAAMAEAIKAPKTLEDFQNFIRYHQQDGKTFTQARMMLTPEQRAAYDELVAAKTRGSRKERTDEQRTTVRAAGQTTAGEIIATKHTRDGHDLWVVKLADRVSKDDYITLLASAKRLGGNYSSFRGNGAVPGFQFRTPDAAQAFLKLAGGDTAQATEVAQERRNAFEDDRSQSAAERLAEMADRLDERADESLGRDRKANTDRRARFAASAEAAARADKAMATTMRNIAKAIGQGGAKFLDRVRQKVQVELLQTYVANGRDAHLRAKYPTYAEQERHKGEAPTIEAADYAEFPTFTAYRSDLASLGRQLLEVDGTKKLGERMMKVADDVSDAFTAFAKEPGNLFRLSTFSVRAGDEVRTAIFPTRDGAERAITRSGLSGKAIVFPEKRGVNRIIMSPSEAMARGIWKGDGDKRITLSDEFGNELVEKIGRVARRGAKVSVPWQFERTYDRRKQLTRMGIETPAEFRAALREFIAMREQPAEADKIKTMERAMIGRRNDGLDFFPTPESVADEMVAAADIQPGMRVLEPSAGWGHIAERIREAGHQPDVVEFSNDRKELLEAKGFNVVGRDFMEFTDANQADRGFTFGDVFRAPDGTLGVMRGSNGMGGSRVGLDPLDYNGQPDMRRSRWENYDDLEPVEKRGVGSGYDRILMNPPFSDGRDIEHVRHAYDLLKPGGRVVAIMGESAFFNQNKRATEFREWLDSVGGTSEKLPEGTFSDPSLPVTTGANARMVVIEKLTGASNESGSVRGNDVEDVGRGIGRNGGGVQGERTEEPSGTGGQGAQFSRAAGARTGVPMQDAKAIVAAIREAMPTAPAINVHDSVKKAPENLRRLIRQAGAENDVEAAYHEGEIHVFPGNIAGIERMQFVVAHHEIRHHGLRSMLGPAMGPAMLRMYASNPNLKAAADKKMADGLAGTRVLAVEEALADMPVEDMLKLTGWQRIAAAARQWLRQVAANLRRAGLTALADAIEPAGWTDSDIAALVQKAENVSRGAAAPFRTGGTVFNRDENPDWYSALADQVGKASMNAGQAPAWKALLKNWISTGKVKADEVEWSGLNEWLDMSPGKITKAQVADYLRANGVQVTETVLGDGAAETLPEGWQVRRTSMVDGASMEWALFDDEGEIRGEGDTYAEALADGWDPDVAADAPTKYANYTLPGGTNYREVLLTLPMKAATVDTAGWTVKLKRAVSPVTRKPEYEVFNAAGESQGTSYSETTEEAAIRNVARTLAQRGTERANYKSGHWDQPNIVAHIRVNDRTDADGARVLFVEEIQSDWGQAAKKQGIAGTPQTESWRIVNADGDGIGTGTGATAEAALASWRAVAGARGGDGVRAEPATFKVNHGVPAAPFIGTTDKWVALAMKRVIKMAVDGGYDKVAFVTGEQSADRYDLSKQVSAIRYGTNPGEGTYNIRAYGEDMIRIVLDEKRVSLGRIEDLVGKEIAKKIEAGEGDSRASIMRESGGDLERELSGVALKVGGEGMRAFYNKIVPGVAKDVLRKLGGGAMETVQIATPEGQRDGGAVFMDEENRAEPDFDGETVPAASTGQPGFTITQQMRDKALGGMPLFSRADQTQTPDSGAVFSRAGTAKTTAPDWITSGSAALQGAAGKIDTYAPQKTMAEKAREMSAGWKQKMVQGMFDAYAPLKALSMDAYIAARMTKAADGAFEGMLMYGKPVMQADGGITGDLDGKGFLGAMRELNGEHDRFFMWLAGNRAERLYNETTGWTVRYTAPTGAEVVRNFEANEEAEKDAHVAKHAGAQVTRHKRENLFEPDEIAAMKALNRGTMEDGRPRVAAFKRALDEFNTYSKSVLDVAEKAGLIDGESRKLWEHDFYVPFYRMSQENEISGPTKIKGLVRQKAFERLKGGKENLGDLMDNTLRNWSHLLSASLANVAASKSLLAAEQAGVAFEAKEAQAKEMAKAAGLKGNATYFMDQGMQRWFVVEDPAILQAVSAMEAPALNGLPLQLMAKFKKYLTVGVTIAPAFKVRNLIRDTLAAPAANEMSFNIAKNLSQGWKATDTKTAGYAQMLFSGGLMRFGTYLEGDRAEHVKWLISQGVDDKTILNTPQKVKAMFIKAWDAWQDFGDRMENVNRTALYQQLLDKGLSPREAAFQARDMMDFSLQGSWAATRTLTAVIPFLNARAQGLYRLGRAAADNPKRMGYMVAAVSLASIILMLAYEDDEDWKAREDWDRDAWWWFKIGDTAYRIPKPFEIGAMGTIAERSVELLINDEMTGARFAERMKQMVTGTFAINPVPQMFKPMMDLYANKDSFTGRQIETLGMERLSKPERYGPNTSALAKALGSAGEYTGISPVQVDHMIRAYFGWLGTMGAATVDAALMPFEDFDRPAKKIDDYFGGFVKELPAASSRYLEDFYKQAKETSEAMVDLRRAREVGDTEAAAEIMEERGDKVAQYRVYQQAQRQLADLNKRIRIVRGSTELDADTKRLRLDELTELRNRIARQVNDRMQAREAVLQ